MISKGTVAVLSVRSPQRVSWVPKFRGRMSIVLADPDAVREAYENIRSDADESTWWVSSYTPSSRCIIYGVSQPYPLTFVSRLTLPYEGKSIVVGKTGTEYDEFLEQLGGRFARERASTHTWRYNYTRTQMTIGCTVTFASRLETRWAEEQSLPS